MSFAHYDFTAGASIHRHFHPKEVWNVVAGELELTIDGVATVAGPGFVVIVPPNTPHSAKAISDGRAIIVDYPLRADMPGAQSTAS
jgi:quercetin dioxygenase-like cupin family protein